MIICSFWLLRVIPCIHFKCYGYYGVYLFCVHNCCFREHVTTGGICVWFWSHSHVYDGALICFKFKDNLKY